MSDPAEELPVHQESLTSVALDGARIACFVALQIANGDPALEKGPRGDYIIAAIESAIDQLNCARDAMPVRTTSLHVAQASPSTIILPGGA
jgi:hypothetical protein